MGQVKSKMTAEPKQDIQAPEKEESTAVTKFDAEYLKKISTLGMEELEDTDLPLPTILLIQKNSELVDDEGNPYPLGHFFYKGTKEIMSEVNCIFLSFTKRELPSFSDKELLVTTWIFLGVLGKDLRPFLLYCKNTALGPAREFLANVKAMMLPMFAVKVKLTSEKIEGEKGTYYKIKFNTTGDIEDPEQLMLLEDLTRKYGPKLKQGVIEEVQEVQEIKEVSVEESEDTNIPDGSEDVSEDLPF